MVVHSVLRRGWRWHVDWSYASVNVAIEVLQVQPLQFEQIADHLVWNLHFKLLEDDVRERDDDRVNRVELESDRVGVQHADVCGDDFDAVETELAEHQTHAQVRLLVQEHLVGDVVEITWKDLKGATDVSTGKIK